jgi:PPK2 family polyphosphate:nucleotide phosphotransferase
MDTDDYRVLPGKKMKLSTWSTNDTDGFDGNKDEAKALLAELNEELAELQQVLYAENAHKVLVVLQGMDTSGKDGTIKHVFKSINPLGVRVANFKLPTTRERSHDYLWRVHQHAPGNGEIVIFNRSHYEDVLVPAVHGLVDDDTIERRYHHIVDFERMLADEGTVIRKFFLHISKGEQKERLEERLHNPAKQWKFEQGDVDERKLWSEYQAAYQAAISATSTKAAPWYMVPADKKWYRNLVISRILIETLRGLDLRYPDPPKGLDKLTID